MPSANSKRRLLIGLTGGFGSGKSTALGFFRKHGALTLDADAVVRELLESDRTLLKKIRGRFGKDVFDAKGRLDRKALAAKVFTNTAARKALERMIHPLVRKTIWTQVGKSRKHAVLDIPLLYESGWQRKLDAVVVVNAGLATRVKRLRKRGFSPAEAKRRIKAQWPLQKKILMADYVVQNDGSKAATKKQIDTIWKKLTGQK